MKIVSIKKDLLNCYKKIDSEVLDKHGRPCLLILRLKYKGKKRMFAIPFRSNIPSNVPKIHYFALPPRPSTKKNHRHGLHYIKMMPITKMFLERYRLDSPASILYNSILERNKKRIIEECQKYLDLYEKGQCPSYCTSIDKLIVALEEMEHN